MSDSALGDTPLHVAIKNCQFNRVVDLLEYLNSTNIYGNTPLHVAAVHITSKKNRDVEIVKKLIYYGAITSVQNKLGNTPLHVAVSVFIDKNQLFIIDLLLQNSSCLDIKNKYGDTPLHLAVKCGYLVSVNILLRYGANTNLQNVQGNTPLHYAIKYNSGHVKLVKLLIISGARLDLKNKFGKTPLHLCSEGFRVYWCLQTAMLLIDKGAPLDIQDSLGNTVLHYSTMKCGPEFTEEDKENYRTDSRSLPWYVRLSENATQLSLKLLECGAKINTQNKDGFIVLHNVIQWGNKKIIKRLIELGTAVDSKAQFTRGLYLNPYELTPFKIEECDLTKYTVKLLTANFDIKIDLKSSCYYSPTSVQDYKVECLNELEKIKTTKIGENLKLIVVFTHQNNPYYLAVKDRLESLDEFFENGSGHKDDFPLYWHILKSTYIKTKTRFISIMMATNVLNSLLKTTLPELVSYKIMDSLDNDDLDILNTVVAV